MTMQGLIHDIIRSLIKKKQRDQCDSYICVGEPENLNFFKEDIVSFSLMTSSLGIVFVKIMLDVGDGKSDLIYADAETFIVELYNISNKDDSKTLHQTLFGNSKAAWTKDIRDTINDRLTTERTAHPGHKDMSALSANMTLRP